MSRFTVIYDANVFYPAPLRDLLLRLASCGLFRARWSKEIEAEWVRNLLINRPELADKLPRTIELINANCHDCMVDDYQHLIQCIDLPDKDDRHVVAAGIKSGAELIITFNLKDFPQAALDQYGIEAIHPDDFIVDLFDLNTAKVLAAVAAQRSSLKKPPRTAEELLDTLLKQGLPQTVKLLEQYKLAF